MELTLPITLTIAAACAIIVVWLGARVSQLRLRHKVSMGDQGNERIVARMRAQERRLVEMEAALAEAPTSVKERLTRLYEHSATELEHSIGLVEELTAQLTLLRFSGLGNPSTARVERGHIEELLLRIEALAEASQPGAGEAPPPAQVARA